MRWFVFDPNPELSDEGPGPKLYGPRVGSWTKADAEKYANVLHPDDESGNTFVLPLTEI